MNLAFYGTLRDPEVLRLIVGNELDGKFHSIRSLLGWACHRIEGSAYPLLRTNALATTIFHLYHDCSEVSWRRLLDYEGSEYSWEEILIDGIPYRVFMAEPSVEPSPALWDLVTFQVHDKEEYLSNLNEDLP